MSHKSSFSLSSINLEIDFFFRVGLPPFESKDVSKKKLKSPAKTICFSYKSLIVSNILSRSRRVATCSVSVLRLPSRHTTSFQQLCDLYTTSLMSYRRRIDVETTSCVYWVYILTRSKLFSSTLTSDIKIRPFLSIFLSKTPTLSLPVYPIATLQELVLPCEKNIGPFNSSAHFFSSAKDEWVSCKTKNPSDPKLVFKYSNILILLREFCSPLILFDIKCNFTP